jgi:serine protease inhibitor
MLQDFFEVLNTYFPTPAVDAPKFIASVRRWRSREMTLPVVRSGSYRYSIVPSFDDFMRLDESVFRISRELQDLLSSLYATGFAFIACIIDASAAMVPIAYEHDKLFTGQFFIPTCHFNGKPRSAFWSTLNVHADEWDHEIYTIGASDVDAGEEAVGTPQGVIPWHSFVSRVPFSMPSWVPTRQLRMLRVQGDHPNRDSIWRAESELTGTLDVCTAVRSGLSHVQQPWYMCLTCSQGPSPRFQASEGCCVACAIKCHAGHALAFGGCTPFFCGCGANGFHCTANEQSLHEHSEDRCGSNVVSSNPVPMPMADFLYFKAGTKAIEGSRTMTRKPSTIPAALGDKATLITHVSHCINTCGLRLLQNASARDKLLPSVWVSPFSLGTALMMLTPLLSAPAASELLSAVGIGADVDIPSVLDAFEAVAAQFVSQVGSSTTICSANSAWIRDGLMPMASCTSMLKDRFHATLGRVPVTLEGNVINAWVAAQTQGRIKAIVPTRLDATFVFALVNALYLKGEWDRQFYCEDTSHSVPFYDSDGKSVTTTVSMMKKLPAELLQYASIRGGIGQAVRLPYKCNASGCRFAAIVVLPPVGVLPDQCIAAIDKNGGLQTAVCAAFKEAKVLLKLPRFRANFAQSLVDDLQRMGVHKAFSKMESGMASTILAEAAPPLFVSDVLQSVAICVDEVGTEAAAATAVSVVALGSPSRFVTMEVNRPFVFFVEECTTHTIAFAGIVRIPGSSA